MKPHVKAPYSWDSDPTALSAVHNVDAEYERFHKLLRSIFRLCDRLGFRLVGRITVIDKRTGKVWK